jgi:hypothetical protein
VLCVFVLFVLLSGVFWRRRDRSLFHVSVFPSLLCVRTRSRFISRIIYLLSTSHPRRPKGMHTSSSPFPRDTYLHNPRDTSPQPQPSNPSLMKIEHLDDILHQIEFKFNDVVSLADLRIRFATRTQKAPPVPVSNRRARLQNDTMLAS